MIANIQAIFLCLYFAYLLLLPTAGAQHVYFLFPQNIVDIRGHNPILIHKSPLADAYNLNNDQLPIDQCETELMLLPLNPSI